MVWQVARAVKIPVVGLGGIMNATDALEFLMAGATAIEIGTANFIDPTVTVKVIEGIGEWLDRHGIADVNEIIGLNIALNLVYYVIMDGHDVGYAFYINLVCTASITFCFYKELKEGFQCAFAWVIAFIAYLLFV